MEETTLFSGLMSCIADCYNSKEFWLQAFILATGIWAQILVAKKNLNAFYFWMMGNVAIIFSALPKAQYGIALLYFLSIGFNLYGVMQWRKDVTRKTISTDARYSA